jgi:hypothetical protein
MKTESGSESKAPFEQRPIFELEHRMGPTRRGDSKVMGNEYELVSVSELAARLGDGRLNGIEYVRCPNQTMATRTVNDVLTMAEAGVLENADAPNVVTTAIQNRKAVTKEDVEGGIREAEGATVALRRDQKLFSDATAKREPLAATIDLSSAGELTRFSQNETVITIGPARILERRKKEAEAYQQLLDRVHNLVNNSFAPRVRSLENRVLDIVERRLKAHFKDQDSLRQAAYRTADMESLAPFERFKYIDCFDREAAPQYARQVLEAWSAMTAVEAKFSDAKVV